MGESELDEIFDNYAKAYYEAKYESQLNTCEWAMDKAKQALLNWHNKQTEALLNELLVDVSSPNARIDQAEMIELINLYIDKLKADPRLHYHGQGWPSACTLEHKLKESK